MTEKAYPSIELFININKEVKYEVYKVYVVDGETNKYLIDIVDTLEEGLEVYNQHQFFVNNLPSNGKVPMQTTIA